MFSFFDILRASKINSQLPVKCWTLLHAVMCTCTEYVSLFRVLPCAVGRSEHFLTAKLFFVSPPIEHQAADESLRNADTSPLFLK